MRGEELRARVREFLSRAEDTYDTRIRPAVPGSPPFWLFSVVVSILLVGMMWGMVFALLGGWHVLSRMVGFLSEATRVYEPTP